MTLLSVIIPVYNEEKAISSTVAQLKKTLKGYDYEIITVDDGSTDKTAGILKKISGITILKHTINQGYGAALKTGIRKAKGEYIAITDADGTYPIAKIPKMVDLAPDYDMVIGARDKSKIPLIRRPAKFVINKFANYLTGFKIPDLNSGLRVFRKDIALKYWNLYPKRFSFTTTITMAMLTDGYIVKWIPITYFVRKGTSTIHPIKDTIGFMTLIFRLTLYFNSVRVLIPLAIFFFILAILRSIRDVILNDYIGNLALILFFISLQVFFFSLIADILNKK